MRLLLKSGQIPKLFRVYATCWINLPAQAASGEWKSRHALLSALCIHFHVVSLAVAVFTGEMNRKTAKRKSKKSTAKEAAQVDVIDLDLDSDPEEGPTKRCVSCS